RDFLNGQWLKPHAVHDAVQITAYLVPAGCGRFLGGQLFVADLNAAVLTQMLTVLTSALDHAAVDHRLVGFDVGHNKGPAWGPVVVLIFGDEFAGVPALDP